MHLLAFPKLSQLRELDLFCRFVVPVSLGRSDCHWCCGANPTQVVLRKCLPRLKVISEKTCHPFGWCHGWTTSAENKLNDIACPTNAVETCTVARVHYLIPLHPSCIISGPGAGETRIKRFSVVTRTNPTLSMRWLMLNDSQEHRRGWQEVQWQDKMVLQSLVSRGQEAGEAKRNKAN